MQNSEKANETQATTVNDVAMADSETAKAAASPQLTAKQETITTQKQAELNAAADDPGIDMI